MDVFQRHPLRSRHLREPDASIYRMREADFLDVRNEGFHSIFYRWRLGSELSQDSRQWWLHASESGAQIGTLKVFLFATDGDISNLDYESLVVQSNAIVGAEHKFIDPVSKLPRQRQQIRAGLARLHFGHPIER